MLRRLSGGRPSSYQSLSPHCIGSVFTAGARASSPALDSKGILYFGAGGAVTALNSATWQTVWKFPISSPDPGNPVPPGSIGVFGAPALDGKRFNDLYVWANVTAPAQPGQLFGPSFMMLYGLDMGDGHPAWHLNASIVRPPIDTGGADPSSPVFVDGASCGSINYCVFATFGVQSQQFVYAHEPFSFFQVWGPKPLPFSSVHSPVAASDGTVYVSTPQGLFALDPSTGNTRWSVRDGANNPSGGAAIGSDGTVYVGGFSNFYAIH